MALGAYYGKNIERVKKIFTQVVHNPFLGSISVFASQIFYYIFCHADTLEEDRFTFVFPKTLE